MLDVDSAAAHLGLAHVLFMLFDLTEVEVYVVVGVFLIAVLGVMGHSHSLLELLR